MNEQHSHDAQDAVLFMQLVAMFQMAAMQHMGKLVDPETQKAERNLDQARASIDMVEMLHRKTDGNLDDSEKAFLDKVLFELRMNYVDEKRAEEKPSAEGDESAASEDEGEETDPPA